MDRAAGQHRALLSKSGESRASFLPQDDEQPLEPTLDVETSPMMEPAETLASSTFPSATPPGRYWRAQGFAAMLRREFDEARESGKTTLMRERFFLLANYYARTLAILRSALKERREPLVQAVIHNLIALHASLHYMSRVAPRTVPSSLSLDREMRSSLTEELIVRIVEETIEPLDAASVAARVNELDLLADISAGVIRRHLDNLVASGYLQNTGGSYSRTNRTYSAASLERAALQVLLGPSLFQQCDSAGFHGLADIIAHKDEFKSLFVTLTNFSDDTAAMMLAASEALMGPRLEAPHLYPWQHADLISSSHLRPYQYEAYAIFRGYGYQCQIIEAPTGSGKTMIGMMCIQDWLRSLSQGQSILVLVPTVNYQQQWVGELCYKPLGLRLSPHLVFTGTPTQLERVRARTGISPCVMVMTYAALAQTGSGAGKGGFDQNSVESFLQGNTIQYVILDEVHKVVEDLRSVSADVTRVLTEWVRDGSLKGTIGFSGTAAAYRPRFVQLGMQLVYVMPAAELIAYGFVAPFAEFGIPFAYSDRERRIRNLLEAYKVRLRAFVTLVGSANWRRWFAEIPMEERLLSARVLWKMYVGQKDRDAALLRRFEKWELGGELGLAELPLITLVQLSRGWSDEDAVRAASRHGDAEGSNAGEQDGDARLVRFHEIIRDIESIRAELKTLVYLGDAVRRLDSAGFGYTLDADRLGRLLTEASSVAARAGRTKDVLATTIVGLYDTLSDWYQRVGEGRVDSIKAIIEAERASRQVHGVIVFDAGTRIRWRSGVTAPGYAGVAGVFGQMLGDGRFTPVAVLSSEMYLPYNEAHPLPERIAGFIRREIMRGELADALFGLAVGGLGLEQVMLAGLRDPFDAILERYVNELTGVAAARPGEFHRKVLAPFRKVVRKAELGVARDKLLARLSLKHYHVRNCVTSFFDYAIIVEAFLNARVAELTQVSGAHHQFFVVGMARGERKQLMYDLTARIVDDEGLGINMIIVSLWARTGWNVLKPNVLIDATATRDVTAWQQLRGRAMRARRSWNNECYRLVLSLLGTHPLNTGETAPAREITTAGEVLQERDGFTEFLDGTARKLLRDAHRHADASTAAGRVADAQGEQSDADRLGEKIDSGDISAFTPEERVQLVLELMLSRNKVTHIYELVKAYGESSQIRFDRSSRQWQRIESISAKHAQEYAVSPLSGQFTSGIEHAPLVYSGDPRNDVPSELGDRLASALRECDPTIVKGWLRTIAKGTSEDMSLE